MTREDYEERRARDKAFAHLLGRIDHALDAPRYSDAERIDLVRNAVAILEGDIRAIVAAPRG